MRIDELIGVIETALKTAGCKSVHFGDTPEWHNNRSKVYPSAVIIPPEYETGGGLDQLNQTYRLKVQVLELSGVKAATKTDLESLRAMQNIVLTMLRDILAQDDVIGVSCRHIPIVREYNDITTGWHLDLNVITQDCV